MSFHIPARLKKILHYALTGISAACLVTIAVFALTLKTPILNSWQAFTIETGSMEPTIPTGSLIFTKKPTNTTAIKVGDIITFEQPGFQNKLITHRVHAIDESGSYLTKGDANDQVDDWVVPFGRVRGLGNWNLPYLGRAIDTVRSPIGIALFVALPVLIIIWQEGRNIINVLVEKKLERFFKHLRRAGYQVVPPSQAKTSPTRLTITSRKFTTIKPAHTLTHHTSRTITQPTRKITITAAATLLSLLATPALAYFISNSVTISNNTITTAANFPSGSPSPSPSPTTSPSTNPSPSISPSSSPEPSSSPQTSPTPNPSGVVAGDCDVNLEANLSNTNTGPNSTNTNEVTVNCQGNQTETNQGQVTNTVTVDANTGGNQQNGNTQGGNTQTGNVTLDFNINSRINTQPTPSPN